MKFSEHLDKVLFEQDQPNPAEQQQAAQRLEATTPLPSQGEQKPIEPVKDEEEDAKLSEYVTKEQLRLALQQYLTSEQLQKMFLPKEEFNTTMANYVTKKQWEEAIDDILR